MRFTRRFVASLLLLTVLASCGHHDHSHDAAGHAHTSADIERPTVAVTLWTDRTELFMEYPVFVAGESGRAAIHVTDLSDFSPLREGEAIVTLRAADGRMLEFRGGPTRPGIFGVDLQADRPGMHVMTLRVEAPGLEDVHELGAVTVYDPGHVPEQPGDEQEEGISFLKEQQWTLDFATVLAEVRALRPSLTVTGAIEARPGGDATLTAPVPGRIDPSSGVPIPGTRVREGDVLARIVPRSDDLRDAAALRAALVEAEQEQGLAARESERVERLVASRAVPARRLDEARAALAATTARLEAARERWSRYEALSQSGLRSGVPGGFSVRAPFAGVVSGVFFASGESVDDGRALVRLVDTDRVHAVGAVPEANAGDLRSVESAELLLDGQAPVELPRPLSVGGVVEPFARTTEVRFALDNRDTRWPVGRRVRIRLFMGAAASGTAIPESAIVEDGGRPVAFVQTGGESFERRPLRLGNRAAGVVHVLEGIEPGERVVHRGAYLVRLAAMSSSVPAHGHVH